MKAMKAIRDNCGLHETDEVKTDKNLGRQIQAARDKCKQRETVVNACRYGLRLADAGIL
jgi:hypothetical protein